MIKDVRGKEIKAGMTVYSSNFNKTYPVFEDKQGMLFIAFPTQIGVCHVKPDDWNDFHVVEE